MRSLAALVLMTTLAHADEPTDHSRKVHGAIIGAGGAVYLGVEFALKPLLADPQCGICEPPAIDASAREAFKWDHTLVANVMSTMTGYVGGPALSIFGLMASSDDWRTRADDVIPVLESSIAVGLLHHAVKFVVGRQRPFVHHAPKGRPYDTDDNASLFSGHTGLAFAAATAGGVVAHQRGYKIEPVIWAGGYAFAIATGYLRMAADKHWLTDVTIGAVLGVGMGLFIPLVVHGDAIDKTADPSASPRMFSLGTTF